MARPMLAREVLALALVLGVLVEILFYGPALGVNLVLLSLSLVGAAIAVRPPGTRIDPTDRWLPVAVVVLAAFVAIRTDPALVAIDTLLVLILLAASMPAIAGIAVSRRTIEAILGLAALVGGMIVAGAGTVLGEARRGIDLVGLRTGTQRTAPVLRGLLLALPIVALFGLLFASADLVFGRWVETLLGAKIDLGDLPNRLIAVGGAGWFVAGALWLAANGQPPDWAQPVPASLGAAAATPAVADDRPTGDGLGVAEAIVILVAVDLLFGLFVLLQVAYLFGGLDTRAAIGATYSDYARRGFFELLAAAALAGTLVGGLEAVVSRRTRVYVVSALALLCLTSVVLVSAVVRLHLYQDAYGWTELRFWALAGIVFVGLGLVATALLLVRGRTDRLPHALGGALVAVILAINVVGPQAFVADRNLERAFEPSLIPPDGERSLDVALLVQLSDDAVPSLVAALPRLPERERAVILAGLRERARRLRDDPGLVGWPAWNLGREWAREALGRLPD